MQKELLSNLLRKNPKAVFILSLGTICYDFEECLKEFPDFKGEAYFIRGAMGCAMGIGLGYALSSKKQVHVIVGDGSWMMKSGSLFTILKDEPLNLFIHVMANGLYASTGRQKINWIKHDEMPRKMGYQQQHLFVYHP